MGHITTEKMTKARKELDRADRTLDNGNLSAADIRINEALSNIETAVSEIEMSDLYVKYGGPILRQRLGKIKENNDPDLHEVRKLSGEVRRLIKDLKEPVEEELHQRLREDESDDVYDESTPYERMPQIYLESKYN